MYLLAADIPIGTYLYRDTRVRRTYRERDGQGADYARREVERGVEAKK